MTILFCIFSYLASGGTITVETINHQKRVTNIQYYKSKDLGSKAKVLRKSLAYIVEHEDKHKSSFIETYHPHNSKMNLMTEIQDYEVRELFGSLEDRNSIVLTILGDGYTRSQKELFFKDAKYMVDDLFNEDTFSSYRKLFTIIAIFTPSIESGVSDYKVKDTMFGLYRSPRGSKRGIMPGNRSKIESVLKLIDIYTDYPVIIANDDYYGGLGGRYAITTRSRTSGAMVLRHELGHNFSNVGEEYDGGGVYSGANFSDTTNLKWSHFINRQFNAPDIKMISGDYVWQDLIKKPYQKDIQVSERSKIMFKFSSVGWSSRDEVSITLNGEELEIDGVFTNDRSFFKTKPVFVDVGELHLEIRALGSSETVLAYANAYSYPEYFDFSNSAIEAFPVYDSNKKKRGYRPTHEGCLMRDMRLKHFCDVDKESIWLNFIKRLSLFNSYKDSKSEFRFTTLPVGSSSSKLFKRDGWSWAELPEFKNVQNIKKSELKKGKYKVELIFSHPEIQIKSDKLKQEKEFKVRG